MSRRVASRTNLLLPSLVLGLFVTALLYYFGQIRHEPWAETIAAPFALTGFSVNVHQGSMALTLVLMVLAFGGMTWVALAAWTGRRRTK